MTKHIQKPPFLKTQILENKDYSYLATPPNPIELKYLIESLGYNFPFNFSEWLKNLYYDNLRARNLISQDSPFIKSIKNSDK